MQVSQLVSKMKEESKKGAESAAMVQLLDKIASLSRSRLGYAKGALAMIWKGLGGSSDPPAPGSKSASPAKSAILPNWHRVKLALLKSIRTGTFIDTQFYAYNSIANDLPLDPRPLFVSSIVMEEWGCAIATRGFRRPSEFVPL